MLIAQAASSNQANTAAYQLSDSTIMHRLGMMGLGGTLGGLRVAGTVRNVGAVAAVAAVGSVAYVRSWPKFIPYKDPATQK